MPKTFDANLSPSSTQVTLSRMPHTRPPSRLNWFSRLTQWLRQCWRRLTGTTAGPDAEQGEPATPAESPAAIDPGAATAALEPDLSAESTESVVAPAPLEPATSTEAAEPTASTEPARPIAAARQAAADKPAVAAKPEEPTEQDQSTAPVRPLAKGRVLSNAGKAKSPDGHLRVQPWMPPSRGYRLLRPATPSPDMKLLVLIHGCKQEADGFAQATGAYQLVASGEWAVLLPDQSKAANLYRCWNWFDTHCIQGRGEVAIVLAAMNEARRTLGLGDARCYVAGLSSGAALAAALVTNRPDQFAGAAFFAGLPMGACTSPLHARQVMANGPERDVTTDLPAFDVLPALVVQGDKDETVNPKHADELTRQMLTLNRTINPGDPLPVADEQSATPAGRKDEHAVHAVERSRFGRCERVIVRGMGHAWSGGDNAWPWFDASGPDGLELITEFFARHEPEWRPRKPALSSETAVTSQF